MSHRATTRETHRLILLMILGRACDPGLGKLNNILIKAETFAPCQFEQAKKSLFAASLWRDRKIKERDFFLERDSFDQLEFFC